MTPRRRMLRAIDQGLPSGFPVVICYLGIFLRDHWKQITDKPWWTLRSPDIDHRAEVDRDLLSKLDLDWMPCSMCPPRSWRQNRRILRDGDRIVLVDARDGSSTQIREPPVGGQHIRIPSEQLIMKTADIEEVIPVASAADLRREGRMDYVSLLRSKVAPDRFLVASIGSPFWRALSQYFGFRPLLVNLRRNPRLVEHVLDRIVQERRETIRAYGRAGVDGIWLEECLASSAEISPADFRRFVLPYNRQLIEEMHGEHMRCIYYTCGDIWDRMDSVIETGTDCISLEEDKKGFEIDIADLDQEVSGKACLFGNLSSIGVLARGTGEELRAEIRRQIQVGKKHGRFVMSLGSPVTPDTPVEKVAEYVRISRQESH